MADVPVKEVEMADPDAAAAGSRPQSTEMTIRSAETSSPVERPCRSAPRGEHEENEETQAEAEIVVQQAPAAATAPSERGHMPTPVSDELNVETRPGPLIDRPASLDNEQDSELSDPDSTVRTPPRVAELEDEIVVETKENAPSAEADDDGDEAMADVDGEPTASHYPKRKRTSIFNDLSESKIEIPTSIRPDRPERTALPSTSNKARPRNSLGGVKGVLLGHWRDSPVPQFEKKHGVIGFIDVRDRLRTRIQPMSKDGGTIAAEYPLPPGPGGSWVTFDRIYFSDHLVGLDHFQVKEYVRMRAAAAEDNEGEDRAASEAETVKAATIRGRELLQLENPAVAPLVAHGALPLGANGAAAVIDAKRRRTSTSFVAIAPHHEEPSNRSLTLDPLHGTRPTRIVLGYWRRSSEESEDDRHAVYGILGQNDMFRVKVVRETRDGRYVDGNFPVGAGALWIHYDEVEFEPHIKNLSRPEIKEYCRIRQYQLDRGEATGERHANEIRAAEDARARATTYLPHLQSLAKAYPTQPPSLLRRPGSDDFDVSDSIGGGGRLSGGHELRQLRRPDLRPATRHSLGDIATSAAGGGLLANVTSRGGIPGGSDPIERTNALAQREIARVEAAQGRADRHAVHRERAAQAADAAAAAMASIAAGSTVPSPPMTNGSGGGGRPLFHESEDIERLNRVWARQESLRLRASSEDARIYDGVKYERKPTGPFMGKLVSQGTIITIDGEDYVEYRVLTKPSFF